MFIASHVDNAFYKRNKNNIKLTVTLRLNNLNFIFIFYVMSDEEGLKIKIIIL